MDLDTWDDLDLAYLLAFGEHPDLHPGPERPDAVVLMDGYDLLRTTLAVLGGGLIGSWLTSRWYQRRH